ncbi:MAG TPA: phosphoketolase family protein [Gammaproteobacteria bacterium]|nr:phosphoketolase family protein [Gammaproteobacteria bacterium]
MFDFNTELSTAVADGDAPPHVQTTEGPLTPDLLARMQRYWQAANYLTVGQIYLQDNALLREPLKVDDIKTRLLGHWGTSPGLSFVYTHLNRLIREHDVDMIYVTGPGHGGPALNAHAWLEGSYSEAYPDISRDAHGIRLLFRQFSTPGGVSSHCGPHLPGSINEGGELGYSLLHAQGAVLDNPDLIAACVIGDGEAETGPLAGSWKGHRFLNPTRDGAVLPILHLNGYKIAGPTVQGRTEDDKLRQLYRGLGYEPYFVEGDEPPRVHQAFAAALDRSYSEIRALQDEARRHGLDRELRWPMIVLRTPKGWTGPKEVDGLPIQGTFRSHQVPLATVRENPEHLKMLEAWLESYEPDTLFDDDGRLIDELAALAPDGDRRMGANPHANGGRLLKELTLPTTDEYALKVPHPGEVGAEAPRSLGRFFRDIFRANADNFRLFCPDETNSNRLNAVFEATDRMSFGPTVSIDDSIGPDGRVMEVLSEHCCEGWLEGYVLTGRHGVFVSYEAFAQIVDSMATQHAKWLSHSREHAWRKPVASLNIFLSSHAWRSDHNGFSHQAPGFVDNALARRSEVIRIYYPPDANCLLTVYDHCLRAHNTINIVTCGKQLALQWLDMARAREHCAQGASRWAFASNDDGAEPDIVLACVGDVPTQETCAAAWLLQKHVPELRMRVVNVVDLGVLMHPRLHPRGMDDAAFESLFTHATDVIVAYHGYTWAIHSMVHGRANEARFHVRGFIDEGTTTTPFDMVVLNGISRYHLAIEALKYVPRLRSKTAGAIDLFNSKLREHRSYIREHFTDMPDIANWHWTRDFHQPEEPPAIAEVQPRPVQFTDA